MNRVEIVFHRERGKWLVVANDFEESSHRLKQQAEKEGRKIAKNNRPAHFVVKRKDGEVSYTQRYNS